MVREDDSLEFKAWVQAPAETMIWDQAQKLIHDTEFDRLWTSYDEQLIGRILKCNILAEYYLARYLEASNPSLGSLKAVRLSFDLIAILRPGLTELNRIRNRIEHRLSPNIDSADLKGMRNLIEALEKATIRTIRLCSTESSSSRHSHGLRAARWDCLSQSRRRPRCQARWEAG